MNALGQDLAREFGQKAARGERLWLFLDYDGTLEEFAPTPDTILPDPSLIALMTRLARFPDCLRVVILSGRRFSHIQTLLPVPGILEAGTYGIEYQTWEGEQVRLLDFETARPFLDQVKTYWSGLITNRAGFYLEDKQYSLALHGRDAPDADAHNILTEAAEYARQVVEKGTFRILGGHKFIEVAPTIADKGQAVSTLLKRFPWQGASLVYFGDDDKDEEAFKVIRMNDGIPILVAPEPRPTDALYRLDTPQQVRCWLKTLADTLEANSQGLPA